MVFSSTVFLFLFLPVVLLIYYNPIFTGRRFRNVFLLIASLVFYAWGEPVFVLLMLLSITGNWLLGRCMKRYRRAKPFTVIAVIFNLSFLFVFKYLGFTLWNIETLGIRIGSTWGVPDIALPIGISFYTFQALSYCLDVGRGTCEARDNILDVGLYISCFPQLIAGPIVRYETFARQIEHRPDTWTSFTAGVPRFVVGLAKKVLLANILGQLTDLIYSYTTLSTPVAWLGAVCYGLQIYFDFSGYSDMAIGLGRMFGFHYLENFDHPYIASSLTGFWRRWHISLTTWFRDYVYIPLGGNRVGPLKHIRNYFVVWLLTGIWHGANWTFIVWGLLYFVFLLIEKYTGADKNKKWYGHVYTLMIVSLLWVVFRSETLALAGQRIGIMFGIGAAPVTAEGLLMVLRALPLVAVGAVCSTTLPKTLYSRIGGSRLKRISAVGVMTVLFLLSVAAVVSNSYNPFIYFNF